MKLKRYYSGDSEKFWKRINKLKGLEGEVIFSMACALRDMEVAVLSELEYAEDRQAGRIIK